MFKKTYKLNIDPYALARYPWDNGNSELARANNIVITISIQNQQPEPFPKIPLLLAATFFVTKNTVGCVTTITLLRSLEAYCLKILFSGRNTIVAARAKKIQAPTPYVLFTLQQHKEFHEE